MPHTLKGFSQTALRHSNLLKLTELRKALYIGLSVTSEFQMHTLGDIRCGTVLSVADQEHSLNFGVSEFFYLRLHYMGRVKLLLCASSAAFPAPSR